MATSPVSSGWRSEFEHLRGEFRHLVEEQHAVMRQRDFARPRAQAAADQRRHRGGMMRRTERPPVGERAAFDLAGDRSDHRDFEQFGRQQRRQDRGQPRRQHRFAGAGRADHQQVMAAGGGDFERALGALLALDVGEIERHAVELADLRLRPRQHLRALEMIGELDERVRGDDLDLGRRPGRFRPAGRRTDQALPARIGADRGRQHAGDGAIAPSSPSSPSTVKPEIASCGIAPIAAISPSAIGRS